MVALQGNAWSWRRACNNKVNRAKPEVETRSTEPLREREPFKKGPWSPLENAILWVYLIFNGPGNWNAIHKKTSLWRSGKSCRLRWANHLKSNLRKCAFSPKEERRIMKLHFRIGNKWAYIASQLNGRTDNDVKNYWHARLKRCKREGLPIYPLDIQQNEIHNPSSPPAHQMPTLNNPLEYVLDSKSPNSEQISEVPSIKPFHHNNLSLASSSTPSFPIAPSNVPHYNQDALPNLNLSKNHFRGNASFFDLSQNEIPSVLEKGKCIDYQGPIVDPNVVDVKLNFMVGGSDFTKMNNLENSSPDQPSLEMKMSSDTHAWEGMPLIDDELASLLNFPIPSPTLDWGAADEYDSNEPIEIKESMKFNYY